jgi:hypothetical protein
MKRGLRVAACGSILMFTALVRAGAPPADGDLLEFLGSLDSEGEGWSEYLARTPVRPPPGRGVPKNAAPAGGKPDADKPAGDKQDAKPKDAGTKGQS